MGDVAEIVGGGTPSTKKSEYWNGNINWFSPAEIGNQIFVSHSQKQITELGLMKSSAKILPAGTILFTSRAGIGNTAILTRNACTNQGFQSIVPYSNKLDSYFIYSESAKLKRYGETMGSGSTFTEVSGKQLKKMSLHIPNINEQAKIGNMLKILDQTITLHEEKKRQLERLKSALLQKMFADKSGYLAVRFKGFDERWERHVLNDLAIFNPKCTLPTSFEYVDLGSVIGVEMISHKTISKFDAPSRAQRLAQVGDLFYQTVRPYQQNNYLFDNKDNAYVFSTGYAQLRPLIDGYFLLCLIQTKSFVRKVLNSCTGTSYPAINSQDLAQTSVNIPINSKEQRLIGNLYKVIDNLITLYQRKLGDRIILCVRMNSSLK